MTLYIESLDDGTIFADITKPDMKFCFQIDSGTMIDFRLCNCLSGLISPRKKGNFDIF